MTAKLQARSQNLLDEDFTAEDMHPADIEQLLIASYDEWEQMTAHTKERGKYRRAYNKLVDLLTEKRGFKQFNYLTP